MKTLVGIARIFVGILFMISGFVKMVDPIGFSYKLQEYFGPGVFNLDFLVPYALPIAIFLVIFEFMLGVMLIIGYIPKFTRWALLLLIVFFTFLTFYSAYFHKVTDCGCFGDAMPLTPWTSFYKDVVLLLLVLLIFFNGRFLKPLIGRAVNKWIVFVVFIGCLGLTYDVLMHLPVIDFRPYKIGASIPEGMTSDGPEMPAIHDFLLYRNGENQTDKILNENKVLFVVSYRMGYRKVEKQKDVRENSFETAHFTNEEGWKAVKKASGRALKHGYDVVGLTASGQEAINALKGKYNLKFDFIQLDETTLKTIVRANPGLLTLHKGTVTQKAHWNDAGELKFK